MMTRSTKTFIIVAALFDALRLKTISFIGKGLTFQNQTSQFKIKITLGVIKKNIRWTQNRNTYIYGHKKILTKTAIFMVTKHKKTYLAVMQVCLIIPFISEI